jgi:hypothetical protein
MALRLILRPYAILDAAIAGEGFRLTAKPHHDAYEHRKINI